MLELGNISIDPDDPCLGLLERDMESGIDGLLSLGGMRRYQILIIMRMGWDVPRVFKYDLGRANLFTADEINLPGGVIELIDGSQVTIPKVMPPPEQIKKIWIEHTVGELQEMADEARGGALEPPDYEPTNMWTEFMLMKEQQEIYKQQNVRTLGQIVDDILYKKREGLA